MALTLREVLELQRRQREEKEGLAPHAAPSVPLTSTSASLQPSSPASSAIPTGTSAPTSPTPVATGRGLLSRLQAAQTASAIPGNVATSPPPKTNGQVAPVAAPQTVEPVPVFTVDETEQLKKNLAFLAANMEEKELLGQILRTTVRQLQEHPELSSIVIDTDYDLIVAAARRSMKYATRKKEDRTEKAGKKKQDKDELDAWLKDQGIEL